MPSEAPPTAVVALEALEAPPEASVVVSEATSAALEASAIVTKAPPEIDCNMEAAALKNFFVYIYYYLFFVSLLSVCNQDLCK